MSPEEFARQALGAAMGVVGWSPDIARHATFAEIELAVEYAAQSRDFPRSK